MNQSHNSNTPKIIGGLVISAILLIGIYTLIIKKSDNSALASGSSKNLQVAFTTTNTASTSAQTATPSNTSTGLPAADNSVIAPQVTTPAYKDGTYTQTASYRVPGQSNDLTAKVTIKDGVITGVATTSQYGGRESAQYISGFESSINQAVSGKSIDNAYIGRVGGASLTSSAFNDIIDAVTKDARA
jgi:hypothetical protein